MQREYSRTRDDALLVALSLCHCLSLSVCLPVLPACLSVCPVSPLGESMPYITGSCDWSPLSHICVFRLDAALSNQALSDERVLVSFFCRHLSLSLSLSLLHAHTHSLSVGSSLLSTLLCGSVLLAEAGVRAPTALTNHKKVRGMCLCQITTFSLSFFLSLSLSLSLSCLSQ